MSDPEQQKPDALANREDESAQRADPPADLEALRKLLEDAEIDLTEASKSEVRNHLPVPPTDDPKQNLAAMAETIADVVRFHVIAVKYQSTFTRYMAALDRKADLRASENERLSRRVQITIAVSTIVLTLATIVSLFAKR